MCSRLTKSVVSALGGAAARPSGGEVGGEFLLVKEAADVARVRPATIRKWVVRGLIKRHGEGKHFLVRRDDLVAYLARAGAKTASEAEFDADQTAISILSKKKERDP